MRPQKNRVTARKPDISPVTEESKKAKTVRFNTEKEVALHTSKEKTDTRGKILREIAADIARFQRLAGGVRLHTRRTGGDASRRAVSPTMHSGMVFVLAVALAVAYAAGVYAVMPDSRTSPFTDALTPATEPDFTTLMEGQPRSPGSIRSLGADSKDSLDRYDRYFVKYTKRYFGPGFDWRWFKAQALAESNLRSEALSHQGATGVMQLMPTTFHRIRRSQSFIGEDMTHPEWNIAAGIFYNRLMWDNFNNQRRSFEDRLNFTFAAYNAGLDNVLQAQKVAMDRDMSPYRWDSIASVLPEITGPASGQTISYINRIHRLKKNL